jgi:uncharacterized protein (DUF2141 family)
MMVPRAVQIICGVVLLSITGCAKQGRPSGGPVDRSAPRVTAHTPPTDATSIALFTTITIEFSEGMDRSRAEEAIFVAPQTEIDMDWRGHRLQIRPRDGLLEGRTYVVTVGADARDLRGNKLENSYSFAFATGAQLDSGEMVGRIISADDRPQRGAYVWAYDLQTFEGTTGKGEPAHVTQTGDDGSFRFERLAKGRYRVIGFVDGNRNQRLDDGESLALAAADIDVTAEGVTTVGDQRLALRQKKPRVERASAVDAQRVLLVFDGPVETADMEIELAGLPIEWIYQDAEDETRVHVRTAVQQEGTEYELTVRSEGVELETPEEPIRGTAREDRNPPVVSRVRPAARVATASEVSLYFSEAMDSPLPIWTGADSTASPAGVWSWSSPLHLTFSPETAFAPGAQVLEVGLQQVHDLAGNALADSTLRISFELLPPEELSTVTGLSDWGEGETGGVTWVSLLNDDFGTQVTADSTGQFRIANLVPGEYVVTAWLDRDEDGLWDAGQLQPYVPAEPFVRHDKIRLEGGDTVSLALPMTE